MGLQGELIWSWLGDKKSLKSILCWGLRVEQRPRVGGNGEKSVGVSRSSSAQWATMTPALIQKQYLGTVQHTLITQQLGKDIWP